MDVPGHIYPVGRLDVDSEGLILHTNDGELTNRLTHPRFMHEKEYRILVPSRPDEKQLAAWRSGVVLDDGYKTKPVKVRVTDTHGKGAWMQVTLTEGRKRPIREMGRLTGLPVVRIIRVRISSLQLGNLKPRQWRHLNPEEVAELKGESPSPSQSKRVNRPAPLVGPLSGSRLLPHDRIERKLCPHHQSLVHTVMTCRKMYWYRKRYW